MAASAALTISVASATRSSAGQSISTMSKLFLYWANSARAALSRAAPVTSRGVDGLEPRTVIASLNGLRFRHSAAARRPLRTCSKPSDIWMPGRSIAVTPSSAGLASTTSSRVPPSATARARLATKVLLPTLPTGIQEPAIAARRGPHGCARRRRRRNGTPRRRRSRGHRPWATGRPSP